MDTTSQRLAKKAHEQVTAVANEHPKDSKERQKYGSMAHKLPVLIRKSGLAQALAFVQAKAAKEAIYSKLLDHIAEAVEWPDANSGAALATKSREEQLDNYILLTRRVSAALIWYKRFAESILDIEQGKDEGGE
ncbi:MAG: type III-B CRISPR module-associated protein Cmr5 [Anaerolineae bacterium]